VIIWEAKAKPNAKEMEMGSPCLLRIKIRDSRIKFWSSPWNSSYLSMKSRLLIKNSSKLVLSGTLKADRYQQLLNFAIKIFISALRMKITTP